MIKFIQNILSKIAGEEVFPEPVDICKGDKWKLKTCSGDPWETEHGIAIILDVKNGWVRYDLVGTYFNDNRKEEDMFRYCYKPYKIHKLNNNGSSSIRG